MPLNCANDNCYHHLKLLLVAGEATVVTTSVKLISKMHAHRLIRIYVSDSVIS